MSESTTGAATGQQEALARLNRAVAACETVEALEALAASGMLDGLARRLAQKWRTLRNECDIHQCVAQAVDGLCALLARGEPVQDVEAYLAKSADYWARAEHRRRQRETPADPAGLDARPDPERRDALVRRAVAIARSLVEQINRWGDNIRAVVGYFIDAAEQGRFHVPHREIAEALDLEEDNVRQLARRGFERLSRAAQDAGYADAQFNFDDTQEDD